MKTFFAGFIFIAILAGALSAETQLRFGLDAAVEISDPFSFQAVRSSFADPANVKGGLYSEIIINQVGFGMHGLVRFERIEFEQVSDPWWLDWNATVFVSYHLVGTRHLLDPFIEFGLGSAGRVRLDDRGDGYWEEDEYGDWHYVLYPYSEHMEDDLSLSVFPVLSAGLALNLNGLLLGTRFSYRPWIMPVAMLPDYPLGNGQVTLFGGIALGGRR
jgi:hypothetical protein